MSYCSNSLIVCPEYDIMDTVSLLAKEQFKAWEAHRFRQSQFNNDAGENDTKAIIDFEKRQIKVFCRYPKDIKRTDLKIADFVKHHSDICELVKVTTNKT